MALDKKSARLYNNQRRKIAALHGVWRSSVAYVLWEHGAKGSNPFTPTICGPLVKRSKTPPFHGGNRSSSLLGVTTFFENFFTEIKIFMTVKYHIQQLIYIMD